MSDDDNTPASDSDIKNITQMLIDIQIKQNEQDKKLDKLMSQMKRTHNLNKATYKLIYSEIYIALNIQQTGGTFVLKVFEWYLALLNFLCLLFRYDHTFLGLHKDSVL